tara:strand:- start:859 stop:1128 length:270 start_codon:yes stop_codon:yes gene_type:complete
MSLKELIQKLPLDKKEHIIVGVVYSALIPLLGLCFGNIGGLVGFLIGTGLNLWKEIWNDKISKRGNAEVLDFIATELPLIITFIALWMV